MADWVDDFIERQEEARLREAWAKLLETMPLSDMLSNRTLLEKFGFVDSPFVPVRIEGPKR